MKWNETTLYHAIAKKISNEYDSDFISFFLLKVTLLLPTYIKERQWQDWLVHLSTSPGASMVM